MQDVASLASIAGRRAGSDAERRAARQLQQRLEAVGRDAQLEPTRVRTDFAVTNLVHAVLGVVGSVVSVYQPALGLALAATAMVSAFGDLTGTFHLVQSLTPVRASQNVVSAENEGKPGLIVLVAHYDSPRTGMLQAPRLAIWPRAIVISLLVVTVCGLGRLLGLDSTWFTIVQFIPTVVLIVSTPLFADAAIADTAAGDTDNAAGVAVVLSLAGEYARRLQHFDLMVVLTGASAHFGVGFRQWLRRHRHELDNSATAVISVDNLTAAEVRYVAKEGAVFASRMHPTLVELAAEAGAAAESREVSDAYVARMAGLPAIRITTAVPDGDGTVDGDALEAVRAYAAALLERIDEAIGPSLR